MENPLQESTWVPDWAVRGVLYHIYPLGFLSAPNQNPRNGLTSRLEDLRKWYGYFTDLGITVIQFGPLFESHSHGYDTIDYFRIDRRLGDLVLFQEIVEELHKRNIRVILDGVFNHTGRGFFAFKDIIEKKQDSAYTHWFHINWDDNNEYNDGFSYQSWQGHNELPQLNIDHPDVKGYIFEIVRFWLGDIGVDGWRLDAADQIDPKFWWEFRRVCKEARPGAFVFGELIHGDYRAYVSEENLDSATNYQLYKPIWSSLNDGNMWELKHALDRAFDPEIGIYNGLSLVNFMGNHDVSRILSVLDNPQQIFLAMLFLMTAPGIPALYYGDEVGMRGHKDEGDHALRQPIPAPDADWPDAERTLFRELKRLIAFRKVYSALSYGRYAPLETGNTHFSFLRHYQDQQIIILLNADEAPLDLVLNVRREDISDGTVFRDTLNPEQHGFIVKDGKLEVPQTWGNWGRILIAG